MGTSTEQASQLYQASASLRENRARYFEENGFGDGGYDAPWVTLKKLGSLELGFPNSDARRRAVRLHDLHHVLAQYGTDWTGEAEIAAFEIGAGCGRHWAAWLLNLGAMAYGLVIAPRAVHRAFVRGRHARSLYDREWREELLDENTGAMREKLGLASGEPSATLGDHLAFLAWGIGAELTFLGPLAAALAGLAYGLR